MQEGPSVETRQLWGSRERFRRGLGVTKTNCELFTVVSFIIVEDLTTHELVMYLCRFVQCLTEKFSSLYKSLFDGSDHSIIQSPTIVVR